jgi:EpsI family protein
MSAWKPFAVLIGLLAATLALTAFTGKVSATSEPGIAMSLPAQLGVWKGEPEEVSDIERRGLPRDTEFERKRYWDGAGHEMYCSIVLAGKHSQSIHRPETCLPTQGWSLTDSRYEEVPLEPGPLTVRALKIHHPARQGQSGGGVERLCYYWFMGKDRLTASHFERIFLTSYDRLLHNVSHRWAYITVTTILPPGASVAESRAMEKESRQRVRDFIRTLFPLLSRPAKGPSA